MAKLCKTLVAFCHVVEQRDVIANNIVNLKHSTHKDKLVCCFAILPEPLRPTDPHPINWHPFAGVSLKITIYLYNMYVSATQ